MWPDNETDIDLLGFEFLVDELEVLLTDERLLPVTVGVSGDWGSGKSSLMEMARLRLQTGENKGRFICVPFSPWRFEDFDHGKVVLMAAVIDGIADHAQETKGKLDHVIENANRLRGVLAGWGVWKGAATVGATAAGLSPQEAALTGEAAGALAASGRTERPEPAREFESVAHFHVEFEDLVASIGDDLGAVVVFVDDMDRCSTETIVETFEAMRLFLHAPKTAYVVGANYDIVEAALDGRYPGRKDGDDALGHNYLEKMLQNTVAVPPLSEPEVQTYINLLFAELRTTPDQFLKLRTAATANRAQNQLAVAMNEGIAKGEIGELSADLASDLTVAAEIGPSLGRGLRGNPRQIKRFLNRFLLRLKTAGKRGTNLDSAALAKLMVLEELHPGDFVKLFIWHLDDDSGTPIQLKIAEELTAGEKPQDPPREVTDWIAQPGIAEWLGLSPSLAGVPLGPYFTFSRDRLADSIAIGRLSPEMQVLLTELKSTVKPKREQAISEAAELDATAISQLLPPLLDAVRTDVSGAASASLLSLAARRSEVAAAMFDMLDTISVSKIRGNFVLSLATGFKDDPRAKALFEVWSAKGSADVQRQSQRALGRK